MLKKSILFLVALSLFTAMPLLAKDKASKCKDKDVAGSYTRTLFGFGFEDDYGVFQERVYVRQLNLNEGGTVHQVESTGQDAGLNFATRTEWNGSWECRKDGTLLATVFGAVLNPVPADAIFPGSVPDLYLATNVKTTYLFRVDDDNTLTLIQAVARIYDMTEDPLDPLAGTLGVEDFDEYTYTRLVPSDADLTPLP